MQATNFLTGITEKLAERWVATLFTPAFVFWAGGGLVALQIWGWDNPARTAFKDLSDSLEIATLICLLIAIAISGFVVQRFDFLAIRLLEGYWPKVLNPFRQWLIERQIPPHKEERAQWQSLDNKTERNPEEEEKYAKIDWDRSQKPRSTRQFMPTKLGNVLRAAELAPKIAYGLDAVLCWPRLWLILPKQARADVSAAREELNTAARMWLWSVLFCLWALGAFWATPFYIVLWPLPVGLLSAWFCYRWALSATQIYASLIRATYELYRFSLYKSLNIGEPKNQVQELEMAKQLNEFFLRGQWNRVFVSSEKSK